MKFIQEQPVTLRLAMLFTISMLGTALLSVCMAAFESWDKWFAKDYAIRLTLASLFFALAGFIPLSVASRRRQLHKFFGAVCVFLYLASFIFWYFTMDFATRARE